ncbi:MAG: DUF6134 family protein [Flavobacteriales bacterium]
MKKLLLVLGPLSLLLFSYGPVAVVEDFSYMVSLDGRPIGTYKVNKTEINGTSNFRVETNTTAGLIRPTDHKFVMQSSFDNSKLVASDMKLWVDNELESSAVIQWDGNQYVKQNGDELTKIWNESVTYSSACVYFEEPVGRSTFFYEKYGKDLEVSDLGNHTYEVKLPSGGIERYTYSKGEVVKVEFVKSFATITLSVTS